MSRLAPPGSISKTPYDDARRTERVLAKLDTLTKAVCRLPMECTVDRLSRNTIVIYISNMYVAIDQYHQSLTISGVNWLNAIHTATIKRLEYVKNV